jgi:N-acetylmuramate 1-kinase
MRVAESEVLKSHNSMRKANDLAGDRDSRLMTLRAWLARHLPMERCSLSPASADASFRRYFRINGDGQTWIAMDAPPEREACEPFVRVAALMREAGLHVPEVIAQDLEQGFLLLTDLGTTTYLQALQQGDADDLFQDAVDTLIRLQLASRSGVLPDYDESLLRREMDLFPEWYLFRHLGLRPTVAQREVLEATAALLIDNSRSQPAVYVHRDFMPRNLMVSAPNPGVLDFQDAVYGPITYDLVSLFRDAFITWEEERVIDWVARYWEKAKRVNLPVNSDFGGFYREFEWMGLQRHLKVLGIFARIYYRDHKEGYLEDTPRFMQYALAVAARYRELNPLARLLESVAGVERTTGHTF